jgi:hypothetical protein
MHGMRPQVHNIILCNIKCISIALSIKKKLIDLFTLWSPLTGHSQTLTPNQKINFNLINKITEGKGSLENGLF